MKLVVAAALVVACTTSRGDGPRDRATAEPTTAQPGIAAPGPAPAFAIEVRRISKHPTCRGNERIKVDDHGALFAAVNQADCAAGTAWSTPYPASPRYQLTPGERDQLGRLIQTSGAMNLPPLTTDPNKVTTDGYRDELEITLGGRHMVAAVEQTEVAAFSKLRQALVDLASR